VVPAPTSSTDAQDRREALDWAAGFRARRSQLRADLRDGTTTLEQILCHIDGADDLGAVRLLFVLESLPDASKVHTRRRLAALGVGGSTPLRDLDASQRRDVLGEFGVVGGAR